MIRLYIKTQRCCKLSKNYNNDKEENLRRVPMPKKEEHELFGITQQLMGGARVRVICEDNKTRLARIPGRLKKRMWVRDGDLVILKPWSYQDEKAEIVYRYTKTEANYLSRRKLLPPFLDLFQNIPPEELEENENNDDTKD
ncbi:MAG: translation initiation factor eIF-1A [Thermoplasmata archaeon]